MRALTTVVVLNRDAAESYAAPRGTEWAAIQVATEPDDWPELPLPRERVLRLAFLDFDRLPADAPEEFQRRLFTPSQAARLVQFVETVADSVSILLVHCEAGISRSPAIAAAVTEMVLYQPADHYFEKYLPNRRVYRMLRDAWVRKVDPEYPKPVVAKMPIATPYGLAHVDDLTQWIVYTCPTCGREHSHPPTVTANYWPQCFHCWERSVWIPSG